MRKSTQLLVLASTLTLSTTSTFALQASVASPAVKAQQMIKEMKYAEALALYELALKDAKSDTVEQILSNRKILINKSQVLRLMRKPSKAHTLLQQVYEYSTDATKKFPDNKQLAQSQIQDLAALARSFNKPQDLAKRTALQLQAVALADPLALKYPADQTILLTQFNTKLNLAHSYNSSAENRDMAPELVEQGLAILKNIKADAISEWTSKKYLRLQIVSLEVDAYTRNKEYITALEVNTALIKNSQSMLTDKSTIPRQLSKLYASYYQQALLLAALDKKTEAQAQLQQLHSMLDKSLIKYPQDPFLSKDKKQFAKL